MTGGTITGRTPVCVLASYSFIEKFAEDAEK